MQDERLRMKTGKIGNEDWAHERARHAAQGSKHAQSNLRDQPGGWDARTKQDSPSEPDASAHLRSL